MRFGYITKFYYFPISKFILTVSISTLAGYPAYIYRASGPTGTKQGQNLYHSIDKVVVIVLNGLPADQELPKFLSPDYSMPAVCIKKRTDLLFLYAEPVKPGNYEFGGTFIFSKHQDFARLSPYPIPLHDRLKH